MEAKSVERNGARVKSNRERNSSKSELLDQPLAQCAEGKILSVPKASLRNSKEPSWSGCCKPNLMGSR
jgi:hypothetical protein